MSKRQQAHPEEWVGYIDPSTGHLDYIERRNDQKPGMAEDWSVIAGYVLVIALCFLALWAFFAMAGTR